MRPIVHATLRAIWMKRKQPETGPVFLSRRGKPYADTRRVGGNPLTKAHRTACRAVGITGFRIHDWRHHFAIWFLKRGGNLRALCQIAGWSSMRMVQRYAVFEQSDLDDLMLRTAGAPDDPTWAKSGDGILDGTQATAPSQKSGVPPRLAKVGVEGSNPFARSNSGIKIVHDDKPPSGGFVVSGLLVSEGPGKRRADVRPRECCCAPCDRTSIARSVLSHPPTRAGSAASTFDHRQDGLLAAPDEPSCRSRAQTPCRTGG